MSKPFLDRCAVSFEDVRYRLEHNTAYCDMHGVEVDGSHIHDYYEIYVKVTGDVSFFHQNELYPLESGDIIFSRPGEMHHCVYHTSCVHDHWCLWFCGGALEKFVQQNGMDGAIRLTDTAKTELFTLLKSLQDTEDAFTATLLLMRLLTLLCGKDATMRTADRFPEKLQDMLLYIDRHLATVGTVEELAARFFVSVPTANRLFRHHVHLSPHKFIETKRLAKAEQLLREGNTVTDACFAAGFTDCSRFIKKFKEKFGITPYKYKCTH